MAFWNKICGITLIFLICFYISEAQVTKNSGETIPKFSKADLLKSTPVAAFPYSIYKLDVISQNFYTRHFGIMCRQELAIEKATKIQFRFRLGSLEQCNYYEGKK